MQKFIVNFVNEKKIVSCDLGTSLMAAAQENNIALANHCGGLGLCGACRVKILQGEVSSVTDSEKKFLSREDLENGLRLACMARVAGNIAVQTLQPKGKLNILDTVLPFEIPKGTPNTQGLAVALDLGTTSIALAVFDMASGENLGGATCANPQASFGSDVMSRICSAERDKGSLTKMQKVLCDALTNSMVEILPQTDFQKIKKIIVSGNTVMQHLMLGICPAPLANPANFEKSVAFDAIRASEIGLPFDGAQIHFMPCSSAFIGGDITSGLMALDLDCAKGQTILFIDLGTNNEMALVTGDRIIGTSTAAGPAFEGAGISQGMRAEEGAICSLGFENGEFLPSVIGGATARGICGSGMIDCLALFLSHGIMGRDGELKRENKFVTLGADGVSRVNIAPNVSLTQKDVRALQLVIGSVKAGVKILLNKAKISEQSLNKIYIAGGFGNFIDKKNALQIGLLPKCNADVICAANTSLLGAIRAIWEDDFARRAKNLTQKIEAVNLAKEADFEKIFVSSLDFS